jgi:hypothetical protein
VAQRTLMAPGAPRSLASRYLLADTGAPPTAGIIRGSSSGLIAEYTFTEGPTSPVVWNRVYPINPNGANLFFMPEQTFATSGKSGPGGQNFFNTSGTLTITDNFSASPAGDTTATRIDMTGTACLVTQKITLSAVPYTISCYVASNTGSALTFRFKLNNLNSSTLTTTATGWSLFTYTGTPSASNIGLCGIEQDASNDVADLLVWGLRLEFGSTATPYQRPTGELSLSTSALFSPPTWNPRGVSFASASTENAVGMFAMAPSFKNATFYIAFQRTANPNPSNNYVPFWGSLAGGSTLQINNGLGTSNGQNQWSGGGVAGASGIQLNGQYMGFGTIDPFDGFHHCFAFVYNATIGYGIFYFDGVEIARVPNSSVGTFVNQYWFLAYGAGGAADLEVNYALNYNVAHSAAQVLQTTAALRAILIGRGVSPQNAIPDPMVNNLVIWEGDSILGGAGNGNQGWPAIINLQMSPVPIGKNNGITGTFADEAPQAGNTSGAGRRVYTSGLFSAKRRRNVIHIFFGANDLNVNTATVSKCMQLYVELCQSYRALGFKVVVLSLHACQVGGPGGATCTNGVNTLNDLRDYGSNPSLYANTWNYYLRNNWTSFADAFVDHGYGNIDAGPVTCFFPSYIEVGSGATGTVNLSGNTVASVTVTNAGSGYVTLIQPYIFGGNGAGATATCSMLATSAAIVSGGTSGYAVNDTVTLAGGTSTQAIVLKVTSVSSGVITGVSITTAGNYTALPTNPVSQGSTSGSGVGTPTFTINWGASAVTVTAAGSGYTNTGLQPWNTVAWGAWCGAYINTTFYVVDLNFTTGTHPDSTRDALMAPQILAGMESVYK